MNNFFFITTYDNISGKLLSSIINKHPDFFCHAGYTDEFLPSFLHYTMGELTTDRTYSFETPLDISIDKYIAFNTHSQKKYSGDTQSFTAFELQHKTLIEKTAQPYRKVNLLVSPILRVNFILQSWMQLNLAPIKLLSLIEHQIDNHKQIQHSTSTINLYQFNYFYTQIKNYAAAHFPTKLSSAQNRLFILALAKVITYDSADIPAPGKSFCFEKILNDENNFLAFLKYITHNDIGLAPSFFKEIPSSLQETIKNIDDMKFQKWEAWQTKLLNVFINKRLYTLYYPHIDKPLIEFYKSAGYLTEINKSKPLYSKLISIQLNSNRPAQLIAYFDNIEETADNPKDIEVLVNIDIGHHSMKELLEKEMTRRKFTLKYLETPKPASFCDLWQPINKLLEITDPGSYFLLNISDEMLFDTVGWDTILKKYVGYFPDHLFRLRSSRNKYRNYFDRWECSFAQDSIPITTKKWIDVGGDWNPCFGPDSFQQLISFYLSKEGMFSNENYLRDIPLIEIKFAGDVPAIGISDEKRWKHNSDHIKAMEICQSYKMQLEARRRAILIRANILAHKNQLVNYSINEKGRRRHQLLNLLLRRKLIYIRDLDTNTIVAKFDYHLSRLNISLTNYWRRLFFFNYFGDGIQQRRNFVRGCISYFCAKYKLIYKIRGAWQTWKMRAHDSLHILLEENKNIKELLHIISSENKKLLKKNMENSNQTKSSNFSEPNSTQS